MEIPPHSSALMWNCACVWKCVCALQWPLPLAVMSSCLCSARHLSVVPEGGSDRLLSRRNVKTICVLQVGVSALNTTQVSRHLRWSAGQWVVGGQGWLVWMGEQWCLVPGFLFFCSAMHLLLAEGQRSRFHSTDKLWRKLTSRSPSGEKLLNCISVNFILGFCE